MYLRKAIGWGAVVGLVVIGCLFWLQVASPEGVHGEVFLKVFGEDTQFAPGYSDQKFRSLQVGASAAEVRSKLGDPLEAVSTARGGAFWFYSRSPTSTHYRLRAIHIEDERVQEVIAELYVD